MATRNNTDVASSTKHIHVGTVYYDSLHPGDVKPPFFDRRIPYIRLRGLWLSAAGFAPSDPVSVDVSDGCIVLRRV